MRRKNKILCDKCGVQIGDITDMSEQKIREYYPKKAFVGMLCTNCEKKK